MVIETKINSTEKGIAYLGPKGSYSGLAAEKAKEVLNLEELELCKKTSINEIIKCVDNNKNIIGVLPVENSIEGLVRETVDNIIRTKSDVKVIQEIVLPISHCLISKSDDIAKIENIISHPQALGQCRDFIVNLESKYNKEIKRINAPSTSEAVKILKENNETYAAIGNTLAARIYKMKILSESINDEKDNKTRFVCIGYNLPNPTGYDRTSIAFTTKNKPGALVDVLNVFKDSGINLSYIDSRPSKKILGNYTFFIDFDGHITNSNVQEAVQKIRPLTDFYRFIGSYPKCESNKKSE